MGDLKTLIGSFVSNLGTKNAKIEFYSTKFVNFGKLLGDRQNNGSEMRKRGVIG